MKETIDKLDFFKIKNFCSAKEYFKRMRIQATDLEKIFSKDTSETSWRRKKKKTSDKQLFSKIYGEHLKLSNKTNNPT